MKFSGGTLAEGNDGPQNLDEVIALHGPRVLGVARRVLRDEALAEDVAQDTFLAFWRDPSAYSPERASLGVWLAAVARNKAIDLVRKEQRHQSRRDDLAASELSQMTVAGPDADAALMIRQAVGALSRVQREALYLAYFEGLTYREVALRLGVPEGTAKTRLRDALCCLRSTLKPLSHA